MPYNRLDKKPIYESGQFNEFRPWSVERNDFVYILCKMISSAGIKYASQIMRITQKQKAEKTLLCCRKSYNHPMTEFFALLSLFFSLSFLLRRLYLLVYPPSYHNSAIHPELINFEWMRIISSMKQKKGDLFTFYCVGHRHWPAMNSNVLIK